MAYKTRNSHIVDDAAKIAVLATPIRIEIVSALEARGVPLTVAELADELGRPADGLYYHLRALVRGGFIAEHVDAGMRRYRSTVPPGRRSALAYKPGSTRNADAVGRVAASMSRLSQRDFKRALGESGTRSGGPARELWAARVRGWVGNAELIEINRLLEAIAALLQKPRAADVDKLVAVHWIVAPIEVKPARRGVPVDAPRASDRARLRGHAATKRR